MKKIFLLLLLSPCFVKAQIISTIAGTGTAGYSGDGGTAVSATLNYPEGTALDAAGNLYVTDRYNNCIRKISSSGVITTIAGNGTAGYTPDGGLATAAQLNQPVSVLLDGQGNIYFTEQLNNVVRKIDTSGILTTVAGTGVAGTSGDGGPATAAELNYPQGLAFDNSGNLYVSEYYGEVIRKIDATGTISTVAGTGWLGIGADNVAATSSELLGPDHMIFDAFNNLYFADDGSHRVRKVDAITGIVTTVAGTGWEGFNGDGGLATSAELGYPSGLCFDPLGNLYIADFSNSRIREVYAATGIIATVVGNGTMGNGGDGGLAQLAQLTNPVYCFFNSAGDMFISDGGGNVVRKVSSAISAWDIQNNGTGVANVKNALGVKLYPIPNNGTFTIASAKVLDKTATVQIVNESGQTVYTNVAQANSRMNMKVSLDNVSSGIYYAHIHTTDGDDVFNFTIAK